MGIGSERDRHRINIRTILPVSVSESDHIVTNLSDRDPFHRLIHNRYRYALSPIFLECLDFRQCHCLRLLEQFFTAVRVQT